MPRTAAKSADQAEEKYLVTDLNATDSSGPRSHVMRERYVYPNGRSEMRDVKYTFEPGKPTEIARTVALRFAKVDPSFEVKTPDGYIIKPSTHKTDAGAEIALDPGQVVATVDELTDKALLDRAMAFPGAEHLPAKPKRADLIKFVLSAGEDPDEDLGAFERVEPPKRRQPRSRFAEVMDPASETDEDREAALQDAINDGDEV